MPRKRKKSSKQEIADAVLNGLGSVVCCPHCRVPGTVSVRDPDVWRCETALAKCAVLYYSRDGLLVQPINSTDHMRGPWMSYEQFANL